MESPTIRALVVSDDPKVISLSKRLLSRKAIHAECRQRLNDSLTLKMLSQKDLLLIDFSSAQYNLPALLQSLEHLRGPQEAILITSAHVFSHIWKLLEKHDYSLVLKPSGLDKMAVIVGNAIERIRLKTMLLEEHKSIYRRSSNASIRDHTEFSPRDLIGISATLMGELQEEKEMLVDRETKTACGFADNEIAPSPNGSFHSPEGDIALASLLGSDGILEEAKSDVEIGVSLSMFCDNLPIGVLELGAGDSVVSANTAISEALGFDRETMTGRALLDFIAPKDHRAIERLLEVNAIGGERLETAEVHLINKVGQEKPFCAKFFSLPQGDGKSRRFITLNDIEERQQLDALRQSHGDLERYIDSIGEYADIQKTRRDDLVAKSRLASLAYLNGKTVREIRCAIGNILNAAILESRKTGNVQVLLALETILQNARKVRDLIQSYSRASIQEEPDLRPFNLKLMLDEVIAELDSLRLFRDVEVEVRCEETLPSVLVDRGKFNQVVRQLMLNALASMKDCNQRILTFVGEMDANEQMVKLTVQDTGRGIAREHLHKLFKPLHSSGPNGFSSLALAAVKEIVENDFDGRMSVRSELGQGSKFCIWLCPEAAQATFDKELEFVFQDDSLKKAREAEAFALFAS